MHIEKNIDYDWLKDRNLILYEVISGSKAYGTNLPTSDEDRRYIYILPIEYVLSNNIIPQVNDKKNDIVGYEISRFIELLMSNNPNVLELLNMPQDCLIFKNPIFDIVLSQKDKFITKLCGTSFAGYAYSQISKAKGTDKKQNWEKEKIQKKDILDFVYVIENEKSSPWKKWAEKNKFNYKYCGVVNIPNSFGNYAVFYDYTSEKFFEHGNEIDKDKILGYKGIIKMDDDNTTLSNQLRLSSIPNNEVPICIISYNQDSYSQYNKDYQSYQTWLKERNTQRYVDVTSHGQKIDGKNMLHCVRLIDMAMEISQGKGIIVRRPNVDYLLSIRKGNVDLQSILNSVTNKVNELKESIKLSNLPDKIDIDLVDNILIEIRKNFYSLK